MVAPKSPQFSTYGGYGEQLLQEMGYNQAVRIGDRIETAGQGGWNPATGTIPSSVLEEIDQAFSNIDLALRTAGGTGWSQVYRVRLYALDTEMTEENLSRMVENIDKWCGGKGGKGKENRPVLTGVGVSKLGQPGMRFEIEVAAYLG